MRNESFKAVAITSILLSLAGCGGEEQAPEQAPVARPVKVMNVGLGGAADRTFPGRVAAGKQVDLSFRVGGPLTELPVTDGEAVKKGQVLAQIDPRDFRIRVDSAQAEFDKAEADIERLSALYEKDAASKAQLDQARAAREVANAALDDAKADLGDTRLQAPFSGNVGETFVENFQDVRPKQPILSLVGLDTVEIHVDLPESIIARVRADHKDKVKVTAKFDVAPDREFDVELSELAAQADPRTQTYLAKFLVPQPEGLNILPGMTASVRAQVEASDDPAQAVIAIPAIAVGAGDSGESYVWVVDQGTMTVQKRAVTTGEPIGTDRIQITDGLASGEMIATSAVSRLGEGMAIRKMGE